MIYKKQDIILVEKSNNKRFIDLEGKKFNHLLVIGFAGILGLTKNKFSHWWCECDCLEEDKNYIKVQSANLKSNSTISCGCHRLTIHTKHGELIDSNRMSEKRIYYSAKKRCEDERNSNYNKYGGRGIKFLFDSFEEFYSEVGERPSIMHTIERMNNNGHYEVGNIRWATKAEQNRNQRTNVWITYNSEIKILSDWAKEYNLHPATLAKRLNNGWCMNCAINILPFSERCSHI